MKVHYSRIENIDGYFSFFNLRIGVLHKLQWRVFLQITVLFLRHHAEGVKTAAETVKQALVDAKTAQTTAEKAIAKAKADIDMTETRLAQVMRWKPLAFKTYVKNQPP